MVQYRDLNAPPSRVLADVVADMRASERQSKTGDAGVKDLGEAGDVVWPRPDGTPVSVRDVDLDLADARQRIEDAEGTLAGAQARIDTALDAEGHIREDEILRNATLLGETVVEQINVTDKIIGTDGVFTGTVDFENINVTNEVLASKISGEHLYGTEIEGGLIYTTDSGAGQVALSDDGYVDSGSLATYPGIRITPADMSELVSPPGLGPNSNGMIITGGRNTSGGRGFSIYDPYLAEIRYLRGDTEATIGVMQERAYVKAGDGLGNEGRVRATPTFAHVRTGAAGGSYGIVEAGHDYATVATSDPAGTAMSMIKSNGREAFLRSNGSDGLGRILSVDSDGVWVKVERPDGSGYWDFYNLALTANDSGWKSFAYNTSTVGTGNPAYRIKGGVVFFRGTLHKTSGTWASGWTVINTRMPEEIWPAANALRAGASSATPGMLLQMTGAGRFEVWLPDSLAGSTTVQLSPMFYPIG